MRKDSVCDWLHEKVYCWIFFSGHERHDHHSFIEKVRKENKRDECYCHIEYYYITFRARANQMTECTHYTIHHSSLYVDASLSDPFLHFFFPPHWEFQFEIHQKGRETSFPRDWDPNMIEFVRQWLGIGEVTWNNFSSILSMTCASLIGFQWLRDERNGGKIDVCKWKMREKWFEQKLPSV